MVIRLSKSGAADVRRNSLQQPEQLHQVFGEASASLFQHNFTGFLGRPHLNPALARFTILRHLCDLRNHGQPRLLVQDRTLSEKVAREGS